MKEDFFPYKKTVKVARSLDAALPSSRPPRSLVASNKARKSEILFVKFLAAERKFFFAMWQNRS